MLRDLLAHAERKAKLNKNAPAPPPPVHVLSPGLDIICACVPPQTAALLHVSRASEEAARLQGHEKEKVGLVLKSVVENLKALISADRYTPHSPCRDLVVLSV